MLKRILENILHFYQEYCFYRPNSWGIQCLSVHVHCPYHEAQVNQNSKTFHGHFMSWMSRIEPVFTKIHTFIQAMICIWKKNTLKHKNTKTLDGLRKQITLHSPFFLSFFVFPCNSNRTRQNHRWNTVQYIFTKVHQWSEYKNSENSKIESKNDGDIATNGRSWFCWCNHFDIQTSFHHTFIEWMVSCVATLQKYNFIIVFHLIRMSMVWSFAFWFLYFVLIWLLFSLGTMKISRFITDSIKMFYTWKYSLFVTSSLLCPF